MIASTAVGAMPSVRRSSAPAATTLSRLSISTWSGVKGGFGSSDKKRARAARCAARFGAGIARRRGRIGPDRGDMPQPLDPGLARQPRQLRRRRMVHDVEFPRAALIEDADAIDQRILLRDEGAQHRL